jgi:hypothetical protein
MPPGSNALAQNIINVLEDSLEEFRDGSKKDRKALILQLAADTLPKDKNLTNHKKVGSSIH